MVQCWLCNYHSNNPQAANMFLKAHKARGSAYYDKFKIRVNVEKSKTIAFTRRYTENRILTPISIWGNQIPTKRCVKYLGVRLVQRLTFNMHINETVRTVYSISRSLYPLLARSSRRNRQNKKLIYTVAIRPAFRRGAAQVHLHQRPICTLSRHYSTSGLHPANIPEVLYFQTG